MPDSPPPLTTPASRPAAAPPSPPPRHIPPPSRQRRAPTSGQLARRRVLVAVAKWLLPALALALLALVAFWPEIEGGDESRVSFRRTTQPRAEALRVVEPRYQGMDELNRPYTVTARAAQQQGSEEILDLDEPRADILLTDGSWIYLSAEQGRYDRRRGHLDLAGEVTIYHDNGTMMRTGQAAVEIEQGAASGDSPVAAQGPFGTLTSEGFRLTERGAVVVFTGQAHAVLEGGGKE